MTTTTRITSTRTAALALALAATTFAGPDTPEEVATARVRLPAAPQSVVPLDADLDGDVDLVIRLVAGPRLVLARNDGSGRFAAPQPLSDVAGTGGSRLLDLVALDLNADGRSDLIGAGAPSAVWFGRADGGFDPVPLRDAATHVATADLDRDGDTDVVFATQAGLVVLRHEFAGAFTRRDPQPLGDAWPLRSLRTLDLDADGVPEVVAESTLRGGGVVWRSDAECVLARQGMRVAIESIAPSPFLARADLDGDGRPDTVVPTQGDPGLEIRLASEPATVPVELSVLSGRLRRLDRAEGLVRAFLRARLPEGAHGLPTWVTLGDPAAPFALELAPERWSAETGETHVWRGPETERRVTVIVDRRRGMLVVSASALPLGLLPEGEVEAAVAFPNLLAQHREAWSRRARGDLRFRGARSRPPSADAGPAAEPAAVASPDEAFVVETRVVGGKQITVLRERRTKRAWTLTAGGYWRPVRPGRAGPNGTPSPPAPPPRRTVRLVFAGSIDGSDDIRIDATGARWLHRHWQLPRGEVTLNGVRWSPRETGTLANSGTTRFLPEGVDFGSARLVRRSGRDLITFERGGEHVLLRIVDSPNGEGHYEAVLEFDFTASASAAATARDERPTRGLLAHLPLRTDLLDVVAPEHRIDEGPVRLRDGAAVFDGRGSLDLPHVNLAERPFAVSMQVRVDGEAGTMGLLEQRAANARGRHLHLMLRPGLRPYMGFYNDDLIADRAVPRDGKFHHVVFQYTGDAQEIWLDGKRVGRRKTGPYRGTRGATRIGRNPGWTNVGGTHLVGALRDVRIYGRALGKRQIATLARGR